MITLKDPLTTVIEDVAERAGGAVVLLKYLSNPVKELSDKLGHLRNL